MGNLTTAAAFDEFYSELTPTDYHRKTLIPARHRSARENLEDRFPSSCDMPFLRSELIGSASDKDTAIRPIDDIDILAIFSNEKDAYNRYRWNSQQFIYRVRDAYDGVDRHQVGTRGQAVRVFFEQGGYVDVAPVFMDNDDDYLLPSGDGRWILTSPFKANRWFAGRNRELGGNLRRLVRFVKKWNREHSSRLSSYHLETMTGSMFSELGTNRREALTMFFQSAPQTLSVMDPGGHSGDLSSGLTWAQRRDIKRSFESASDRAERALEAEDAGNHSEAKRLWRLVLGDDFPN